MKGAGITQRLPPDLSPEFLYVTTLINSFGFDDDGLRSLASPAYRRAGQIGARNEISIWVLPAPGSNSLRRGEAVPGLHTAAAARAHLADIHAPIHAPPHGRELSGVQIVLAAGLCVP